MIERTTQLGNNDSEFHVTETYSERCTIVKGPINIASLVDSEPDTGECGLYNQ
jgi:hypothetical protein